MNCHASLLPVALSLAAVCLALPAHAQWVKGATYYGKDANGNGPSQSTYGTTTLNSVPAGVVTLTSSSVRYPQTASGNFGGTVCADYTWTGAAGTNNGGFGGTHGFSVNGSTGTSPGFTSSSAGSVHGDTNNPNHAYSSSITQTFVNLVSVVGTNTKITLSASISATTSNIYQGSVSSNANVTLGGPVIP